MGGMNPLLMQQMMGGYGNPYGGGFGGAPMGGMPGAGFGGVAGGVQPDTRPPREKYATQLQQIKEMGFHDEETILQILQQSHGNVNLALEVLFNTLGSH